MFCFFVQGGPSKGKHLVNPLKSLYFKDLVKRAEAPINHLKGLINLPVRPQQLPQNGQEKAVSPIKASPGCMGWCVSMFERICTLRISGSNHLHTQPPARRARG